MVEKMKKLTFNISEESHKKLKILAAVTGQTMTQIILESIEKRFAEYEKSQK